MNDQPKKVYKLKPRHIFLCCAVCIALLGTIFISQQTKLGQVKDQTNALQGDYDKLLLEEQRLERMLEYAQTDEYIEQLAREKLGYVGPDDYKFYRDD